MTIRPTPAPSPVRRGALLGWTLLALSGCALPPGAGEPGGAAPTGGLDDAAAAEAIATAPPDLALAALVDLEFWGRASCTGYDRDEFVDGWVDTERFGCDLR